MSQEARELAFKKWRLDIIAREQQWMESHPEADVVPIDFDKPKKVTARIEESQVRTGNWNLYVDNKLIEVFFPPNAQMKATARLGEILNENK